MATRILALVGAVAMVVAAIVVRNHLDERAVTAHLTCDTELADVCDAIEKATPGVTVTVEPAGTTADRLVALPPDADPGVDGWLTVGPWAEMVDAERTRNAAPKLFTTTSAPVSSPLVAVVENQRAATVRKSCGDPPNWACIPSLFPKGWGDSGGNAAFGPVKEDVPDPGVNGDGLSALGAMTTAALKGEPFARDNDAVLQVLRNARGAQLKAGDDAVTTMLLSGGFAQIDVVTTTEATANSVLATAANRNSVSLLYPAPVTSAVVQFGEGSSGKAAAKLAAAVSSTGRQKLEAAGWKPGAGATTTDAGTLAALRSMWKAQG
jgi:hypothetical protein